MTMRSMTRGTGARGGVGNPGPSAYEIAVTNGFVGTEAQWLASLEGPDGPQGLEGLSAYEVAVANGFVGTESAWLASLVGPAGTTDHGTQTGLGDDDHTQYALADGSRGAFAATAHTHAASQVTDFNAAADARVAIHTADATDAHAASAITNTPAGNIAATTVQAAINELDTEKAAAVHGHSTGDVTGLAEFIRDTVAATLVPGANVTITNDDPGDTITIAATGGGGGLTQQQVMAIGALRP